MDNDKYCCVKAGCSGKRSWWIVASLLIWSFASVWLFHSHAADHALRHSRVAEGNISKAVAHQWNGGVDAFARLVKGDGETWGRVRPVHWLYQNIPFFLTVLRNGDVWHEDAECSLSRRINGDLQTHALFQMSMVGLTFMLLGLVVWRSTGRSWVAFLLPPLAASGPGLAENLLVNYIDSGEIGQIFFISAYLLTLSRAMDGHVPRRYVEWLGYLFLLFAFGMKETTIALTPVAVAVLVMLRFLLPAPASGFGRFVIRQACVHAAMGATLIYFVWRFRSGAYVASYQADGGRALNLVPWWHVMGWPDHWLHFLFLGLTLYIIWLAVGWRRFHFPPTAGSLCLLMLAGAALSFFLVTVPWGHPLAKYTYPAYVFATSAVALLLWWGVETLCIQQLRPAAWLWGIGVGVFILLALPSSREWTRQFYRHNYAGRGVVPVVAADISDRASATGVDFHVRLFVGSDYQEGSLPFLRTINRVHQLNVIHEGKHAHSVPSIEKNYFRVYPDRPGVEITATLEAEGLSGVDQVYMLRAGDTQVEERLIASDFVHQKDWWIHGYGRIARFDRRGFK